MRSQFTRQWWLTALLILALGVVFAAPASAVRDTVTVALRDVSNNALTGGVLTLVDHVGNPLANYPADYPAEQRNLKYKYRCGGSWSSETSFQTDANGQVSFTIGCTNWDNKITVTLNQVSLEQDVTVNSTFQAAKVNANLKSCTAPITDVPGGTVAQGGGYWYTHGTTGPSGTVSFYTFPSKIKLRMTYNHNSQTLDPTIVAGTNEVDFQTTKVTLVHSGDIKSNKGGSWWMFSKPSMDLLPGDYDFWFKTGSTWDGPVTINVTGCSLTGGVLTLVDEVGNPLANYPVDYPAEQRNLKYKYRCGGSWAAETSFQTDANGQLFFNIGCSNWDNKITVTLNQTSLEQDVTVNTTFQAAKVNANLKSCTGPITDVPGGTVDQGGGYWYTHGTTGPSGTVSFYTFPSNIKLRMSYNHNSQTLYPTIVPGTNEVDFQTTEVTLDYAGDIKSNKGGSWWMFNKPSMDLLPGDYDFWFKTGSTWDGPVTLDVSGCAFRYNPQPSVSVADVTVCEGGNTTLTANATGCDSYNYQWYAGSSVSGGTLIGGATDSTYAPLTSGDYTCLVTCVGGGTAEDYGTLTINPLPTVTVADKTVSEGEDTTLTANASGCATYSYQWYAGSSSDTGTLIPGATGSTYAPTASGDYACVVTCDATGCSNEDFGTLTINQSNDEPVAVNDSYSTNKDTTLNVAAPGVLGNDSDPDGGTLNAVKVSDPAHGTVTLNSNGSFDYVPTAGYSGPDSFTYKANDGSLDSNVATVSITVEEENEGPVAVDDSYSTNKDTTLNITAPGVLGNDSDPDGDTLSAVKVSDPAHGTLTLNSDGSFDYVPTAGYSGPDSFTYKANDGSLDSGEATVSITVRENCVSTTGWMYTYSAWAWDFACWDMCRDVTITKYDRYDRSHVCEGPLRERECMGQQLPRPNPGSCPVCLQGVLFQSDRNGNWEIYRADGCDAGRLTYNQASDTAPQWDTTRQRIAFQSDRDGNWEIYAMDGDGNNQVNLSKHAAADMAPTWSCSQIYFQSDRDGNWEIYRMNTNGSGQTRVTNNLVPDAQPAASCAAGKIAYQSLRDGDWELCLANLDGSGVQCITDTPWDEVSPSWSPSGDRIAFQTNEGGMWRIAVLDVATRAKWFITRGVGDSAESPAWYYTDCEWIYFQGLNLGDWDVYRVKPDGTVSERAVFAPGIRDMLDDQVIVP